MNEEAISRVVELEGIGDKIERYVGVLPDMIKETSWLQAKDNARGLTKCQIDGQESQLPCGKTMKTRGSLKTLPEIIRINNNNKIRGKTPPGHTLLDRVIRNNMGDLDPYAQNAITTMTARVLQGHFKKECPRMKNNKGNRGNQAGNDRAPAKVSQIDITPSTLDHYYDVELADGRIIGLNTILKGCTLNFLNHQFHINLMPVELGSFDAIIGMDWLAKYQAVIVCAEKIVHIPWRNKTEKIVHIPWRNKTLIIHGDGSTRGNVTRLNIISCTKAQKYMEKGFPIFLAHVTAKEVEDKSEKKRLEDHLYTGTLTICAFRNEGVILSKLKSYPTKAIIMAQYPSPWGSSVCLSKEGTGSSRMCIDTWKLNKLTVNNRFPLSQEYDDLFDQLQGSELSLED
ncbi:putative reverse transcriptase domain-containing protein [Tanacetum coccineum]